MHMDSVSSTSSAASSSYEQLFRFITWYCIGGYALSSLLLDNRQRAS